VRKLPAERLNRVQVNLPRNGPRKTQRPTGVTVAKPPKRPSFFRRTQPSGLRQAARYLLPQFDKNRMFARISIISLKCREVVFKPAFGWGGKGWEEGGDIRDQYEAFRRRDLNPRGTLSPPRGEWDAEGANHSHLDIALEWRMGANGNWSGLPCTQRISGVPGPQGRYKGGGSSTFRQN